ncbi:ketoacyl-ACP synthase III [Amycolatopsis rhizosphaerae]|uniref:Ketoacyl-ACP synthase III n=1 Tax=Amycolatopsis rhizosphaerae TaxID=2053003 RepID=A0A558A2U8_9PSEU|nr:ketoacyl-ACP synthase III [Amycolatopsis rhizosphaerae]TVT18586.1 ketoacyl-ACP synthase III [Amycolatopsis rhizosphaerae]
MLNQPNPWAATGVALTGFGLYYPRNRIVNEDFSRGGDNPIDASVLGTVSVRARHRSSETETIPYMGAEAGRLAVADAGLAPAELDLVVLASWTVPPFVPEHAPETAALLGCPRTLAFDVSGACTGFIHATGIAAAHLNTLPHTRHALVVCSEQFSRRARPGSKGELVCGDAAGAVVLSKRPENPGLIDLVLRSDGERAKVVSAPAPHGWVRSQKDLPEHAVSSIVEVSGELLRRNGLDMDTVDWVVPHPGTDVVHNRVREALGVPAGKFVVNFQERGNTSSASIPIVLAEARGAGRFRPGDLVLSPAIGAGWYYGAMLYRVG